MIDVMSRRSPGPGLRGRPSYDASINNGVPPIEVRKRFDENLELVLRALARAGRRSPGTAGTQPVPAGQHVAPPAAGRRCRSGSPASATRNTMQMCLERGFGFNYLQLVRCQAHRQADLRPLLGDRRPGRRATEPLPARFPADHRRLGDRRAGRAGVRRRTWSTPSARAWAPSRMEKLALPGSIDIRGVQALLKDPGDFGLYYRDEDRDLPRPRRGRRGDRRQPGHRARPADRVLPRVRHRQPARHARLRLAAAPPGDEEHPALLRRGPPAPTRPVDRHRAPAPLVARTPRRRSPRTTAHPFTTTGLVAAR